MGLINGRCLLLSLLASLLGIKMTPAKLLFSSVSNRCISRLLTVDIVCLLRPEAVEG